MSETESANDGFYFLSLEVENVRCFGKKQRLDLSNSKDKNRPAQWTVILGNNGTGKTTLLEILAKGIFATDSFTNSLRRINTIKSKIVSNFAFNSPLVNSKIDFLYFKYQTTLSDKGSQGSPNERNSEAKSWHPERIRAGDIIFFVGEFAITPSMYFSIAYSASRTIKNSSPFLYSSFSINESNEQGDLINAEKWLKDTFLFSEAKAKFKNHFPTIKETLIKLLPDVTNIDVYFPDENKPELKVRFLVNNIWLSLNALSLGYQTMITWIVDLAARLFNFYPDSPDPIKEPAIVLIDEIDLHLHPKWQREIMRYLSERFINTQFIVTAHSPLIVQAAEDENANIVVLRREGDEVIIDQQPKAIHGWRVDQLLASDLFGLEGSRSVQYEKRMKERREILGKSHLTDADKNRLEELKTLMGNIPTAESPEDIEAMDIIRNVAKLLKEKQ